MNPKTSYVQQLDRLFETFFEELRALPDKDVLNGEDPKTVRERARARLEWARAEVGRRRLASAREAMAAEKSSPRAVGADVTAAQARAYLARIASTRPSLYTLAARKLDEMSDEDLLRLYRQVVELEEKNAQKEP